MKKPLLILFIALCAIGLSHTNVVGSMIVQPTVVGTSFGPLSGFSINNVANQGGFNRPNFPTGYTSGVTDFSTFTSTVWHNTNTSTGFTGAPNQFNWISASSQTFPGYIDFDLGSSVLLDGAAVWNGRAIGSNGITFFASADATFANLTSLGTGNLMNHSSGTAYVQSNNFSFSPSPTQYVRMRIDSTYDTSNSRTSLGEVAFSVVPEPATKVLGCTLLLVVAAIRRRVR